MHIIMSEYACHCILQHSEANNYTEQRHKAVESLSDKVSQNYCVVVIVTCGLQT